MLGAAHQVREQHRGAARAAGRTRDENVPAARARCLDPWQRSGEGRAQVLSRAGAHGKGRWRAREALGVLAFIVGLAAVILTANLLVNLWHDWAEDRRREAEYADAWQRVHRQHQHDRHDHADERKPE